MVSVTIERKSTLFSISDDLAAVHLAIVDAGGVLDGGLEAALNAIYDALEAKVDAIGYRRRAIQTQASLHAERAAYPLAQKRAYEAMEERLDSYLLTVMQRLGTRKLEGTDFTATLSESQRAIVDDPSKLPAEFWVQKPPEIMTGAVRKALMDGVDVPGARLEPHQYVRVK